LRVLIAEDHALLRDGLIRLLEAHDFEVVEAVDNGPRLVPALVEHRPDVAVVDVRLPPTFTDEGLRAAIERSGYYPGLVSDAVASALGSEPVTAYVVHHDAIFDPGMEVRRHMTVLALTPTRLVYSHTDEHPAEDSDSRPRAETSTEAIRFGKISSVALSRVVPDPAAYVPGVTMPSEVMLTIGWNVLSHLEIEPAHCGDESCEADHGYLGTITADDFSLRVSQAADGEDAVRQLLSFGRELSDATAIRGS